MLVGWSASPLMCPQCLMCVCVYILQCLSLLGDLWVVVDYLFSLTQEVQNLPYQT